jgi:hypothetical protein
MKSINHISSPSSPLFTSPPVLTSPPPYLFYSHVLCQCSKGSVMCPHCLTNFLPGRLQTWSSYLHFPVSLSLCCQFVFLTCSLKERAIYRFIRHYKRICSQQMQTKACILDFQDQGGQRTDSTTFK